MLIPHMGVISEEIVSISKQYNDHGKNDFLARSSMLRSVYYWVTLTAKKLITATK